MVDTGSVFSFLSPGSKDSFSIEFFAARKTPDDVTVFNARVPREDSIFDLSSESNSINIYGLTDELKVVISNKNDFKWAIKHKENVKPSCKLYLQPEWSKKDSILPIIIDFVTKNPEWTISLQAHKYMNIP